MENISLVETDKIDGKIQVILRQTNYTEATAREKLQQFDYNEIAVIKDYFGITEKKTQPITSVNQAIYRQLRTHLDGAMSNYRERVEKGEVNKIV
jgi:hypothetical protein